MSKSSPTAPTGRGYRARDVYSFRTSPATEFSPRETNRYGALKILGFKDNMLSICYVVLDGVFDRHPDLTEVSSLPWLKNTRFSWRGVPGGVPACSCVAAEWENDLTEIRYVGSVDLSQADVGLLSACRSGGPWSGASTHVESEWRWHNDRAAYVDEVERYRRARDDRIAAEHERYRTRLRSLTWEKLLAEQAFSRWDDHPPFPPPEFAAAARDRIRSAILELQALGPKPKKTQVRVVLKACVEWFNTKDREFGEVIETEEREDIYKVLEELAFVARQRSLVEEIERWRSW